jgi:nucleotide-binding universal stress UspA family protein
MFKHILLPTDGSPISEAAMRKGIQFAKAIDARVTGFCVIPKLRYFSYDAELAPVFKKQAEAAVRAEVNKNLLAIEKVAKEAGVPCETAQETSDQPYEAIIEAAQKKNAISSSWLPTDGEAWRGCCSAARLKKC